MEYIQTQLNNKSDKWSVPNTETILSQYMEYIQTQLNYKSDKWLTQLAMHDLHCII